MASPHFYYETWSLNTFIFNMDISKPNKILESTKELETPI